MLSKLFVLKESGPVNPTKYGPLDASPEIAEKLLQNAIKVGKSIAGTAPSVHMWRVKDNYIGVSIHDEDDGWGLVWTCPVAGQRVGIDQKTANTGSKETEIIDPLSSEIDDYAIVVNWISPEKLASMLDVGN